MTRILLSLALFWFIGVAPSHAAPPIKVGAVSAGGQGQFSRGLPGHQSLL